MKIMLNTNFGCARGMETFQTFGTLGDAQDWAEAHIRAHWPAQCQADAVDRVQDCNVKGLTNLLTNVCKFHFTWIA